MEIKDIKEIVYLTEEEKKLGENKEGIKQLLISKAILDTAKKYEFTPEEKEEFEFIFKNEKAKYFIAKQIEGKISINEDDVVKLYTENKAQFDAQNIQFSQAKEIIQRDMLQHQLATLEESEINKLVQEMGEAVEISKEEILFSKGNPEILKTTILGKIIERKIREYDFEKNEEANINLLEGRTYINYYLDLQIRKNVVVTQEEVAGIYEAERAKLGNITPNDAYNQIANGLINNKANEERSKIVNRISEEYKIEELLKEYE